MQARELGKQGEDFRSDEVFGSIKSLVNKGNIDALLKNDITGTGTTPLEDISKNHPGFANLSYASLGIDPTGIDLNGDGIINEDERALLSNSDREKIIKADSNILADYVLEKYHSLTWVVKIILMSKILKKKKNLRKNYQLMNL